MDNEKEKLIEILNQNVVSVKNTLRMITSNNPSVSIETLKSIATLFIENDIGILTDSIEKIKKIK